MYSLTLTSTFTPVVCIFCTDQVNGFRVTTPYTKMMTTNKLDCVANIGSEM